MSCISIPNPQSSIINNLTNYSIMKKILSVVALVMTVVAPVSAEVETTIGADVVSSYIWRGTDCGSAAIQPSLSLECSGLGLSFWGSYGLVDPADTKEFDITLSYGIGGFSAGITDYWFSAGSEPLGRYLKYESGASNHTFEGFLGYDLDFLSLGVYTNFYNDDDYSTYVELSAPFSAFGADWTATAGFVPMESELYGTGGFAVTNLTLTASKELEITDKFSLPISAGITVNPCSEMAYMVLGISF